MIATPASFFLQYIVVYQSKRAEFVIYFLLLATYK